jgi:hypothetical protein
MARVKREETQGNESCGKAPVPARLAGNERGMALILALVMLALLTILGAWALDTSTTDLKIAGNSRNTQNAFYSADAALAYATNPATLTQAYLDTQVTGTTKEEVISIGTFTANTAIDFLGAGPLPAGSIYDGDLDMNGKPKFYGLYFAVNTEGKAAKNAAVAVETSVVQVVGN